MSFLLKLFRLYTMRTLTAIINKAFAFACHLCLYELIFQDTCLLILRHRLVFPDKIFSSQVQTLCESNCYTDREHTIQGISVHVDMCVYLNL